MAKLDLKLVMVVLALFLLVMLLNDTDAAYSSRRRTYSSRRRTYSSRRRTYSRRRRTYSSRRRSSYNSSRSTTSASSGLVIGLSIFGTIVALAIIGFVIGYCCCRKNRRNATGSVISTQPNVRFQTENQTGRGDSLPPYTAFANDADPYPTKKDMYPPPGETVSPAYPPPGGPGDAAYPPAYPISDGAMGGPPMYTAPVDSAAAYPPPQVTEHTQEPAPPQVIQPPQGPQLTQAWQQATPLSQQVPLSEQASAPNLPPPAYDDALKDNQGGIQSDAK